jgi:anti-sigma regulatory factor (Ser/Thr protein kinase)
MASAQMLNLKIPNKADRLQAAAGEVRTFLENNEASFETIYAIDMASEELLTNIIKYGYPDDDSHQIDISVSVLDGDVCLKIEDDGSPFDPTAAPPPDLTLDLEDMPIGGLGIHLVKGLVDRFVYSRVDDCNRVEIVIGLEGKRTTD